MKVACVGGGPAGFFLAILMKLSDENHDITVVERNPAGETYGWGVVYWGRSTPLVIGVGDGEMFVGWDVAAFVEHTRDAVELGQDQAVVLTADGRRPTPTRRGRRPYGSASSQTGGQKPCVWPRFAMHRIAAA
jgi:2-polyprenyl-6-methoxyphenol hydroxylase-like FAD-dependent oxidoreductase